MKKYFYFLFLSISVSLVFGCSKLGDGAESPQTDSDPTTEVTDEHVDLVLEVAQSTETKLTELLANEEITNEELRTNLMIFLQEQEGVNSVEFDGEYTLEVIYDSGLSSYVLLESIDSIMGGEDSTDTELLSTLSNTTGNSNKYINNYSVLNTTRFDSESSIYDTIIENNKVLIWSPYESDYPSLFSNLNLNNIFGEKSNYNFVITHLKDDECDLASLYNLKDYGTIIFFTHGGNSETYGLIMRTKQEVAIFESSEIKEYYKKGYIACETNFFGRDVSSTYRICSSFIQNVVPGEFPKSIIYNGACKLGVYNTADSSSNTMWDVFKAKGAKVYIGYDNDIDRLKCITNANVFFDALVGTSASQSTTPITTIIQNTNDSYNLISAPYSYDDILVSAQYMSSSDMSYGPIGQISEIDINPTFATFYLNICPDYFKFNSMEIKYRVADNDVDFFTQDITFSDGLKLNNLEPNTEYKIVEANIIAGNAYYNNSVYYEDQVVSENNPIIITTNAPFISLGEINESSVVINFQIYPEGFKYDYIAINLKDTENGSVISKEFNYNDNSIFSESISDLEPNTEYEIYSAKLIYTSDNQTAYKSLYSENNYEDIISEDNPIIFTTESDVISYPYDYTNPNDGVTYSVTFDDDLEWIYAGKDTYSAATSLCPPDSWRLATTDELYDHVYRWNFSPGGVLSVSSTYYTYWLSNISGTVLYNKYQYSMTNSWGTTTVDTSTAGYIYFCREP